MKRAMRRKDRQITDQTELLAILLKAEWLTLSMCDNGTPYCVPLNFGHDDNALYVHCARTGYKVDILKENPAVCFSAVATDEVVSSDKGACEYSTLFESVTGFGTATILTAPQDMKNGLTAIMRHYSDRESWDFDEKVLKRTTVIRIDIEEMTAKRKEREE